MTETAPCTAFADTRRIAAGPPGEVAVGVKRFLETEPNALVLVFDDATGRAVDFDLRGSETEIRARLDAPQVEAAEPRGRGRPKLGVVPREVTLLPRHWDWLNAQPGGASVALRKLVEQARASTQDSGAVRAAQDTAYRVMHALAGDRAGYEEAIRALYAGDQARFADTLKEWPADVSAYASRLASPAFQPLIPAEAGT